MALRFVDTNGLSRPDDRGERQEPQPDQEGPRRGRASPLDLARMHLEAHERHQGVQSRVENGRRDRFAAPCEALAAREDADRHGQQDDRKGIEKEDCEGRGDGEAPGEPADDEEREEPRQIVSGRGQARGASPREEIADDDAGEPDRGDSRPVDPPRSDRTPGGSESRRRVGHNEHDAGHGPAGVHSPDVTRVRERESDAMSRECERSQKSKPGCQRAGAQGHTASARRAGSPSKRSDMVM